MWYIKLEISALKVLVVFKNMQRYRNAENLIKLAKSRYNKFPF